MPLLSIQGQTLTLGSCDSMQECDHLPGRLAQICRGEVLTLDLCNAYRALPQFGSLPPLAQVPKVSRVRVGNQNNHALLKDGPGRQLQTLFSQLGVEYREDCQCAAYARQMDLWGVAGCRECFDEIVSRLRTNAEKYSVWEHMRAAVEAVRAGLAFRVNPVDPFPDLVAEAIRRAEAEESAICPLP